MDALEENTYTSSSETIDITEITESTNASEPEGSTYSRSNKTIGVTEITDSSHNTDASDKTVILVVVRLLTLLR